MNYYDKERGLHTLRHAEYYCWQNTLDAAIENNHADAMYYTAGDIRLLQLIEEEF